MRRDEYQSVREALNALDLDSYEELFIAPPERDESLDGANERFQRRFRVNEKRRELARPTSFGDDAPSFAGAGHYDHYSPLALDNMIARTDLYSPLGSSDERGALAILNAVRRYREVA